MAGTDLFAHRRQRRKARPLADRMRPASLEEFVGQRHLLGPGRILTRVLQEGSLPSLIFWGPPGCGKTTLARLVAEATGARFVSLSAVLSGVRDLRAAISEAEMRLTTDGQRTILFVDEIHRFNKAQQDALLPHVESGTVVFMGATTENPSFEVISALLSRCKVLRLEPLSPDDILVLLRRALSDPVRGLGKTAVEVDERLLRFVAEQSEGDARKALNTLEVAVSLAPADEGGTRRLTEEVVREALQRRTLLYDKAGEEHYNVVSAFIKSMRGSDPDAAVYWMVRMLEAGEDPLFILRRMVIFAAEDIGNADPQALGVAVSALQAFQFVGLPEGVLPMTEAVLYLATAPKSNTSLTTYAAARKDVLRFGALPVPMHLRNAPTRLMKEAGYGAGYRYPHNFEGNYTPQDYLPKQLKGRRYYRPSTHGYEKIVAERLAEWARIREGRAVRQGPDPGETGATAESSGAARPQGPDAEDTEPVPTEETP